MLEILAFDATTLCANACQLNQISLLVESDRREYRCGRPTRWVKAGQNRRKARDFHVSPRYTVKSILLEKGDIGTASETVLTATETTIVSLPVFAPCFSIPFIASILLLHETG